jgi:hypothetical protein
LYLWRNLDADESREADAVPTLYAATGLKMK